MEMFVFTGLIWKENTEFSALCPELDVASQGRTPKEAQQKLLGAATFSREEECGNWQHLQAGKDT